jgi:ferric-dicitrate binding protein FerR (iron transport regulator)
MTHRPCPTPAHNTRGQCHHLRSVLSLSVHAQTCLIVDSGMLWLTIESQAQDHCLKPGQRVHLQRGQRVLMEPWQRGAEATWHWELDERPLETALHRLARHIQRLLRLIAAAASAPAPPERHKAAPKG